MTEIPWQLQLVNRSLKKKEKLKLLERNLHLSPGDTALDLGCAQGILSYFLRKKGAHWTSADLDFQNLLTSRELLQNNLIQVGPGILPFRDEAFDLVVSLDYLEHLDNDQICLEEIRRILKPGGKLVLATPRTGRPYLLNRLRPLLGMKLEFYGHKREGYQLRQLQSMLAKAGLTLTRHHSFSRFFSELIELLLNALYIKFFPSREPQGLRDGHIRPATGDEFQERRKAFRLYGWIYPIVWLITRLDYLLFFQRGYGLMAWAVKD